MTQRINQYLKTVISPTHAWKISLLKNWKQILGSLSKHVTIEKITDDTLILGVMHSTWAHELHLMSHEIKNNINVFLKTNQIKINQMIKISLIMKNQLNT